MGMMMMLLDCIHLFSVAKVVGENLVNKFILDQTSKMKIF